MGLFDVGGKFKPRNVAGVASARFIEPHGCEEIDEWRVKYSNAEKLAKDIGAHAMKAFGPSASWMVNSYSAI